MTDQRLSYHLRLAEYDGLLCSDAGAGCAFPVGIVLALLCIPCRDCARFGGLRIP